MKRYFLIAYTGTRDFGRVLVHGSLEVAKDGFPSKEELIVAAKQLTGNGLDIVITSIYEFEKELDYLTYIGAEV